MGICVLRGTSLRWHRKHWLVQTETIPVKLAQSHCCPLIGFDGGNVCPFLVNSERKLCNEVSRTRVCRLHCLNKHVPEQALSYCAALYLYLHVYVHTHTHSQEYVHQYKLATWLTSCSKRLNDSIIGWTPTTNTSTLGLENFTLHLVHRTDSCVKIINRAFQRRCKKAFQKLQS